MIGAALLLPSIVHAQVDQRCWTEDDCYNARKAIFEVESPKPGEAGWEKVFRQDNTTKLLCEGETLSDGKTKVGMCLPAVTAKTKISIGGEQEFEGLAQFVAFIYRYGMSLAAVLAILVIIFAGVQWTISGGSSEAISSAQHKIYGAVIGLVVLAVSYTILYTINPDLVNLRPPNIWMINTQKIAAPFCGEITNSQISKTPSNKTGQLLSTEQKKAGFSVLSPDNFESPTSTDAQGNPTSGICGNDYYVQKTGALTCRGTACTKDPATGQTRVCYDKNKTGTPSCNVATFAGEVYNSDFMDDFVANSGFLVNVASSFFGDKWEWEWTNDVWVQAVCVDGTFTRLSGESNDPTEEYVGTRQAYRVLLDNEDFAEAGEYCNGENNVKGLVLYFDFNEEGDPDDEQHFVGRSPGTNTGIDLGDNPTLGGDQECLLRSADQKYFIPLSEAKEKGVILNVNMANIVDIDDGDDNTAQGRRGVYKIHHYDTNCL